MIKANIDNNTNIMDLELQGTNTKIMTEVILMLLGIKKKEPDLYNTIMGGLSLINDKNNSGIEPDVFMNFFSSAYSDTKKKVGE